MSLNVDSSLLTGMNTNIHKVPRLVWFDDKEKRLINYGSHIRELIKLRLVKLMRDILYYLNNDYLSSEIKTIYEELADNVKSSASINTLLILNRELTIIGRNRKYLVKSMLF